MSEKHLYPENQEVFTSSVTKLGNTFLDIVEKEDLCTCCFFNYFVNFMTSSILDADPNKKAELLSGIAMAAGRILNAEVGFVVHKTVEEVDEEMQKLFNVSPIKGSVIQ
mgnify:CR=1 FL=1